MKQSPRRKPKSQAVAFLAATQITETHSRVPLFHGAASVWVRVAKGGKALKGEVQINTTITTTGEDT